MKEMLSRLPLAVLVAVGLVACEQSPAGLHPDAELITEVVLTQGVPAPPRPPNLPVGLSDLDVDDVSVGGSEVDAVSLKPQSCEEGTSQTVRITYHITGRQGNSASFKIYTNWYYDGSNFLHTEDSETVNVPAREAQDDATVREVDVLVSNASNVDDGKATFVITPFDVSTTPPAALGTEDGDVIVHVAFVECPISNTPPAITIPADRTVEATTSAGTIVGFRVPATDAEDGDLTDQVTCVNQLDEPVESRDRFPIGTTEVTCSVIDSGGLSAEGTFFIHVQDTTAPTFTIFPDDQELVAEDIDGATLNLSDFTIEAKDWGPRGEPGGEISPPVEITCAITDADDEPVADGSVVGIGETVTVSCTATDAASFRSPDYDGPDAPNSRTQSFDVFVGLDLSTTCGFEAPLKNEPGPYSAHKGNSTIPHKVCPPAYADGTLATDLAGGLKLVLKWEEPGGDAEEVYEDPATGSTVWRYDEEDEHYVFNARTSRNWANGTWMTTVGYAGIELARTYFILK